MVTAQGKTTLKHASQDPFEQARYQLESPQRQAICSKEETTHVSDLWEISNRVRSKTTVWFLLKDLEDQLDTEAQKRHSKAPIADTFESVQPSPHLQLFALDLSLTPCRTRRPKAHIHESPTSLDRQYSAGIGPSADYIMSGMASGSSSAVRDGPSSITSITPYSPFEFEQLLKDARIYGVDIPRNEDELNPEPKNLDSIKEMLSKPRDDATEQGDLSVANYIRFRAMNSRAWREDSVVKNIIPLIYGSQDADFYSEKNKRFTTLEPFNERMSKLQPDMVDGERNDDLFSEKIIQLIGKFIKTQDNNECPHAPNFFLEAKSRGGEPLIANLQILHAGAAGARAMRYLRAFPGGWDKEDNTAYTLAWSYVNGTVSFNCFHVEDIDGKRHIFGTLLEAYTMSGKYDQFKAGILACRNARQWAREKRNGCIELARQRADSFRPRLRLLSVRSVASSSEDELSKDPARNDHAPSSESPNRASVNESDNNSSAAYSTNRRTPSPEQLDDVVAIWDDDMSVSRQDWSSPMPRHWSLPGNDSQIGYLSGYRGHPNTRNVSPSQTSSNASQGSDCDEPHAPSSSDGDHVSAPRNQGGVGHRHTTSQDSGISGSTGGSGNSGSSDELARPNEGTRSRLGKGKASVKSGSPGKTSSGTHSHVSSSIAGPAVTNTPAPRRHFDNFGPPDVLSLAAHTFGAGRAQRMRSDSQLRSIDEVLATSTEGLALESSAEATKERETTSADSAGTAMQQDTTDNLDERSASKRD